MQWGKAVTGLSKGAGPDLLLRNPARGVPVRADNRGGSAWCHTASWKFTWRHWHFLGCFPGSTGLVQRGRHRVTITFTPRSDSSGGGWAPSPAVAAHRRRALVPSALAEHWKCQEWCPDPSPTLCHMALLKLTLSCMSPSPTPLQRPQHLLTALACQGHPSALPPSMARAGCDHGVGPYRYQALCTWHTVHLRL